jgi:inhibitor of KinA
MMKLLPLGDQAVLAYLEDETAALDLAARVRSAQPGWAIDVVQAYASVAVFFDLEQIQFLAVAAWLELMEAQKYTGAVPTPGKLHSIPCCYEMHLDLDRIVRRTGLNPDEIIRLHTATDYTIYAIGFCPGFPYLGYLPPGLSGVPRLETPRLQLAEGSVGLTGRQTGIYTEARPGGWNIVGRTPLELVNVVDGYFPLRSGDRIRFVRIDELEYCKLHGQRL